MTKKNQPEHSVKTGGAGGDSGNGPLEQLNEALDATLDSARPEAAGKRHAKGYRTARENLEHLCDKGSFIEYGQLAVAAQRKRLSPEKLKKDTAADGILTGLATVNRDKFGEAASQVAIVINDYSVLAGTQGYFHHQKLDRMLEKAIEQKLPVVMYTEGGGGRPGDTDVTTQIAGLTVPSFALWAGMTGSQLRIAVNNGYCFAGNAALFGCADIRIATKTSWIGMAGPAMISGGGLGDFEPTEIGPIEVQRKNGVVDIVADNEKHATDLARRVLGYFQALKAREHAKPKWTCPDQEPLRSIIPANRRVAYKIRKIIETLADEGSFLELGPDHGRGIVTGFLHIEGRPFAVIANDCTILGGAIDSEASAKTARFLRLCDAHGMPVLSLCDTPGFMVGPKSEEEGAALYMSDFYIAVSSLRVPLIGVFLRRGYGLGAMAMMGGSFRRPLYAVSWPLGNFGGMGLEGAVRLGFKKELETIQDTAAREKMIQDMTAALIERGRATEAAAFLEIDAVIDPVDTRRVVIRALEAAGAAKP